MKPNLIPTLIAVLCLAATNGAFGQTAQPPVKEQEPALIAVLKSEASQKEKADACRLLAQIGTKDAVPALAALLADEKLSHMARYALEPIPSPAVDEAFRAALGKLTGAPLVGVIGSIGVRHDSKAITPLAKLLQSAEPDVATTAARALGEIGTADAAKTLEKDLGNAPIANQPAICEGLLRCAESLAAKDHRKAAMEIYDRLRASKAPAPVLSAALRGAALTREKDGLPILLQALRGDDAVLATAAARTAQELPGTEATKELAKELPKLAPDRQIILIQALGKRADALALPVLSAAAKSGEKSVRLAALRALPEIGKAAAGPVLTELTQDTDADIAKVARESLAALPAAEAK